MVSTASSYNLMDLPQYWNVRQSRWIFSLCHAAEKNTFIESQSRREHCFNHSWSNYNNFMVMLKCFREFSLISFMVFGSRLDFWVFVLFISGLPICGRCIEWKWNTHEYTGNFCGAINFDINTELVWRFENIYFEWKWRVWVPNFREALDFQTKIKKIEDSKGIVFLKLRSIKWWWNNIYTLTFLCFLLIKVEL